MGYEIQRKDITNELLYQLSYASKNVYLIIFQAVANSKHLRAILYCGSRVNYVSILHPTVVIVFPA